MHCDMCEREFIFFISSLALFQGFFFLRRKPIKYIVHLVINFAIEINAKVRIKKNYDGETLITVLRNEIENSSSTPTTPNKDSIREA